MGSKGYVASSIFNNSVSCLASYLAVIERFPICDVVTFALVQVGRMRQNSIRFCGKY